MKESLWGYWIVVLGLFIIVVMMLLQNYTTTNQQDYYLLKEVADAAMNEAIDYAHYRKYGEVRIIKERFVENFVRRFSETVNINKTYNIKFYDIYEAPPKASVKITTSTDTYSVMSDTDSLGVVNRLDAILETVPGKFESGSLPPAGGASSCASADVLAGETLRCLTLKYNDGVRDSYDTWCKAPAGASSCIISSIASPNRTGYTFDGWSTSSSCAGSRKSPPINMTSNSVLYACWKS